MRLYDKWWAHREKKTSIHAEARNDGNCIMKMKMRINECVKEMNVTSKWNVDVVYSARTMKFSNRRHD